jgi:hypothetical protein
LQAASGNSAMYHALNVCIALVEPLPPTPADQQAAAQAIGLPGGMPPPAVDAAAAEVHAAMRAQATQCIARSIDRLVALLEATDQGRQLPTSYGLLQPPVGLPRLKAVELLAALLHSGDEAAGALLGHWVEPAYRPGWQVAWLQRTEEACRCRRCVQLRSKESHLLPTHSAALVSVAIPTSHLLQRAR